MRDGERDRARGFSLLELLVVTSIFLVICGVVFELLELSQRNYSSEAQMSGSFQEARLVVDQMVRDFNQSGYPDLGMFSVKPTDTTQYAVGPVAWDPGYPTAACNIGTGGGGTCVTPGDFDLIVETNTGNGVSWIRYQLLNETLYRTVVPKTNGGDPVTATSGAGVMVPFLTNVLNNPSAAQLAEITATYPTMFPLGRAVPIFQYSCDTGKGPEPCPTALGANTPAYVRDVDITLIMSTPTRNMQTEKLMIVELNGRGHRLNPSN